MATSESITKDGYAFALFFIKKCWIEMNQIDEQSTEELTSLFGKNEDLTKLYDDELYTAFTEDLEFMWRWTIYRENKLVQEGCSLTEDASRHAVNHVMAFFNSKTDKTQFITGEA